MTDNHELVANLQTSNIRSVEPVHIAAAHYGKHNLARAIDVGGKGPKFRFRDSSLNYLKTASCVQQVFHERACDG